MVGKFTEKRRKRRRRRKKSRKTFSIYFLSVLKVHESFSGDDYMEEIPVPIPNTEVKLQCADDICGLPC